MIISISNLLGMGFEVTVLFCVALAMNDKGVCSGGRGIDQLRSGLLPQQLFFVPGLLVRC